MITIEVGPTTSRILGEMNDAQYASLRYHLSFEDKDAYHKQRSYGNRGRFIPDRKYLITEKRKQFRTGLLSRVCAHLDLQAISYTIADKRQVGEHDHPMPLRIEASMRDYQNEAILTAIREMNGMIRVATGGGKTRIAAGIVASLERNAVVLVHRLDLMHQVIEVLSDLMLYPEIIGRVGGGVYEPNVITVCTVQTICAALGLNYQAGEDDDEQEIRGAAAHADQVREMLEATKVLVVDEAHHTPARTISEVLERCENASWKIGLSATDWRDDGQDLLIEAAIGPRIFNVTLTNLMDLGYLVQPDVLMVPMAEPPILPDSDNWNTIYKSYYTDNENFHQQTLERNRGFYEAGRHVLTLVTAVKHGERLEALHRREGMPTVFLSGRDSTHKRQEVLDDVRAGRLRMLIGTSIADEGLDLPILDTLNNAGGGKSTTKAYQRIGRILRPFPGKEKATVIDYRCYSDSKLKKHAGSRANIYRTEPGFNFREVRS